MIIMMLEMLGIEFYFQLLDLAKIMNERFGSKSNFARVQVGFNHKLRLGHVFYWFCPLSARKLNYSFFLANIWLNY